MINPHSPPSEKPARLVIFDLDGTLANTLPTVIELYNAHICRELRCRPLDIKDKDRLENQPLRQTFREYGIAWYKVPVLIWRMRHLLNGHMHHIQPFRGITEVLAELHHRNYQMGLLTSNSARNARKFLLQHQLADLFQFIRTNGRLSGKHLILKKIMKQYALRPDQILYIGDEPRDIQAAHRAGTGSVAVSWGYLGREALASSQPRFLVDDEEELLVVIEHYFQAKDRT